MIPLKQFKAQKGISKLSFVGSDAPDACWFASFIDKNDNEGKVFYSPVSRAKQKENPSWELFVTVNDGTQNPELEGSLWLVCSAVTMKAEM
jgi:hypothetical protein